MLFFGSAAFFGLLGRESESRPSRPKKAKQNVRRGNTTGVWYLAGVRGHRPSAHCRTHSHGTWPHITPNPQAASAGLAVGRLATAVAARRPSGTAAAPKEAKAGFRPSSGGLLSPRLGGHYSTPQHKKKKLGCVGLLVAMPVSTGSRRERLDVGGCVLPCRRQQQQQRAP